MKTLLKLLGIIVLVTVIGFVISCGGGGGGGSGITTPPGEKPGDSPSDSPGGEPECSHNWSDWLVIHIPVETVTGIAVPMTEKRTCLICGETQTRNTTTFTPTVIIDLTTGGVTGGVVNTVPLPNITILPAASDAVLIIGDGTNGGTGRYVTINNAEQIYIADGATIYNTSGPVLSVSNTAAVTGGGNVVFTGGNAFVLGTSSGGGITISGSISAMTNLNAPLISISSTDLTISGTIGALSSNNICIQAYTITISGTIGSISGGAAPCIVSNDLEISGTIGDITSTNSSVLNSSGSGGRITISGTTGDIKGGNGQYAIGSYSICDITISGKTGVIKGGDNTSGAGGAGIELFSTGNVTITGTVEDIMGGLGDASPLNDGPQIRINGTSYNNWPSVKSWS